MLELHLQRPRFDWAALGGLKLPQGGRCLTQWLGCHLGHQPGPKSQGLSPNSAVVVCPGCQQAIGDPDGGPASLIWPSAVKMYLVLECVGTVPSSASWSQVPLMWTIGSSLMLLVTGSLPPERETWIERQASASTETAFAGMWGVNQWVGILYISLFLFVSLLFK